MSRERWGTFSVIDHRNTVALVPEVLLYDRLVIPVPYDPPFYDDRLRWELNGWDPDGLEKRLEQLGDLALRKTWSPERQQMFRSRMEELEQTKYEANDMAALQYGITRFILANEQPKLPSGILPPVIVAAYQSEEDFKTDFILEAAPKEREQAHLGLLLGQRLAMPLDETNPDKALLKAISLARDSDFKDKRRNLYEWQERVIRDGYKPEQAMQEIEQLIDEYNSCVKKAMREVYYKFVFTVAGIALSLVGAAALNPLVATGALLSIVQFATLDRKPVIQAGKSEPAAMFHDVKKVLG